MRVKSFFPVCFFPVIVLFFGCQTWFSGNREDKTPAADEDAYLNAGPVTKVDQGPQSKNLLQSLIEANKQVKDLKEKNSKLTKDFAGKEGELKKLKNLLQEAQVSLAGVEMERDKALGELRERQVDLLALALDKVRKEQEVVRLKLDAAQKKSKGKTTPGEGESLATPMEGGGK